jgi:spindle assembly abnormal protein 6
MPLSQNDVKLGKEKVRRKHAIVLRQEEELQAREQALGSALRELQGLTAAVEMARGDRNGLVSENQELKAKLEESKAQLQSNEQMIRWLNQQVRAEGFGFKRGLGVTWLTKPIHMFTTSCGEKKW